MKKNLLFWLWNDKLNVDKIREQIKEFHEQHVEGFFIHAMPEEFRPNDFHFGMPGYLSDDFMKMVGVALECAKEYKMEVWLYDEGGWPSGNCNGTLPMKYPHLRRKIIRSTGEIQEIENRLDLLNPECTQLFLESTYEKYKEHFAADFGRTIPGIFTDEPSFGEFAPPNYLPWSDVLAARFQEVYGYSAMDAAMRILKFNDAETRVQYAQTLTALICENYMAPIQEWCHRNGLLFTGHFNGDNRPDMYLYMNGGDVFEIHKHFDIPGCDTIWRQIHPLLPETDYPRLVNSAAKGKPVISEMFSIYGPDLTPAEMKYVAAMEFIGGVDIMCAMANCYTDRDDSTPCFNNCTPLDPKWKFYHLYGDFVRRTAAMTSFAVPVVKAYVNYPVQAIQAGTCQTDIFEEGLKLARQQITYMYQKDMEEVPAPEGVDIQTVTPCPMLRTRHLHTSGEERRLLVNAGMEPIHCELIPPEGKNVWYDPATGIKTDAYKNKSGNLELDLPFAGAIFLLTTPGITPAAPEKAEMEEQEIPFQFSEILEEYTYEDTGLTRITPAQELHKTFCGTVRYKAEVTVTEQRHCTLSLPEAKRAMCELMVNGKSAGKLAWGPYCWELTLEPGKNELAFDITHTSYEAFADPAHVEKLRAKDYINMYVKKCLEYEKLFPDESPLQKVVLRIQK